MAPGGSPPTRRVIEVIELLAEAERPLTVSAVSDRLSLARATVTAILGELCAAGWVVRDAGRAYRLGRTPGGPAAGGPERMGPAVEAELAGIAETAGCGVTLSRIDRDRLTVVAKHYAGERIVPGLAVGQSIPPAYPAGAAVMPWRERTERDAWLATAGSRRGAAELLWFVTTYGYAVFRPDHDDAGLVDVLTEILGVVGAELLQPALRTAALRQLGRLTSRPYTATEIAAATALPVSYVSAPVRLGDTAPYEVQLGPLRSAVDRAARTHYIDTIRTGAEAISVALRAARE